mmetsp:Transcript_62015/g.177904  ORF Transcript_62015/g.177904 Transcript_62015/m.177904 type:complete len:324 (+) Transcript_62015:1395-2366(+)
MALGYQQASRGLLLSTAAALLERRAHVGGHLQGLVELALSEVDLHKHLKLHGLFQLLTGVVVKLDGLHESLFRQVHSFLPDLDLRQVEDLICLPLLIPELLADADGLLRQLRSLCQVTLLLSHCFQVKVDERVDGQHQTFFVAGCSKLSNPLQSHLSRLLPLVLLRQCFHDRRSALGLPTLAVAQLPEGRHCLLGERQRLLRPAQHEVPRGEEVQLSGLQLPEAQLLEESQCLFRMLQPLGDCLACGSRGRRLHDGDGQRLVALRLQLLVADGLEEREARSSGLRRRLPMSPPQLTGGICQASPALHGFLGKLLEQRPGLAHS